MYNKIRLAGLLSSCRVKGSNFALLLRGSRMYFQCVFKEFRVRK